jgi:hypothetical protein
VLLEVNGTLHLYFIDFKEGLHSVFRASAPFQPAAHGAGGVGGANRITTRVAPPPTEFAYQGIALPEAGRIVNDLKLVNGYYLLGAHCNGQSVYYSASRTPDQFPPTKKLFSHRDSADEHMVSLGFVIDHTATRVLGALYGAGATSALDNNRVFVCEAVFVNHLCIKTIILPRQAREKRRESTQNQTVFSGGVAPASRAVRWRGRQRG